MSEPKKPETALILKFDAEQAMSIRLWAKSKNVALTDLDGISVLVADLVDGMLEAWQDRLAKPTPPQEKGAVGA